MQFLLLVVTVILTLGTALVTAAGLLNLLIILDALARAEGGAVVGARGAPRGRGSP